MTDRQITVNVTPAEGNINVSFGQAIHKVQADYDQQDTSAASYIKNKPPKYKTGDGVTVDNVTGEISIDTESEVWSEKQDVLTPGDGIDIENNEISVDISEIISAGDGIEISDGKISIDTSNATDGYILYAVEEEVDGVTKLVVRWGVPPTGNYIDLLNKPSINGVTLIGNKTTSDLHFPVYTDMTGASASTAGTSGLVPAPAAGDQEKFLRGDGVWGVVETTDTKYTAGANIAIDANDNNKISVSSGSAGQTFFLKSDGNGGATWSSALVRSVNNRTGDLIMYPQIGSGANALFFSPQMSASDASGDYSEAHGYQTKSAGNGGVTFGYKTKTGANAAYAEAHGSETTASGNYSVAFGGGTTAYGANSFAVGLGTMARGDYSFAAGDRNQAIGQGSFAVGNQSYANGVYSFASGASNANGNYSFAANYGGATGERSAAFGLYTTASGVNSFAAGWNTKASGSSAAAFGRNSNAIGQYSFAAGASRAEGTYSAAFGNASATGLNAFAAGGSSTVASEDNSAIFGLKGTTPVGALFTIANGSLTPSTAFNVYANGNIEAGVGWTPTADNHLATKKYVDDNGGGGGTPDWNDIQNKPASYPPSAHTHVYSDITNPPTIPVAGQIAIGDTGYATGGDVFTAFGSLSTVASTGDYQDLINLPSGMMIQQDAGGYYIETGV